MANEPPLLQRLSARLGPATFGLLAGMFAIHVVFLVARNLGSVAMMGLYEDHLALSIGALKRGEVQTLLTYGFLHDLGAPWHLLFNLLVLFFFGPMLERRWGTQAFLRFFLVSIVAGGLLQVGANLVSDDPHVTVGASAGLMALLAAFSWSYPDARVMLFFVVPVQARYLVAIVIGIDFLAWLTGSDVAFFAHLGGLSAAFVMLRGWPTPGRMGGHARRWRAWLSRRVPVRRRRPFQVIDGGRKGDRSNWN